jgi:DNA-binding transcriptional regulator PaaX
MKPRSEIVKEVIKWLMFAGIICIAATSPYFLINLTKSISKWRRYNRYKRRNISSTFSRLSQKGLIKINKKKNQIYISLTGKGKQMAGRLQIDALEVKRPPKWDHKWRIVIFDIAQLKKNYREAFRGRIKELGFVCLQKSVWVHAFECRSEIALLRDFFRLNEKELRLIIANELGEDVRLRKHFEV